MLAMISGSASNSPMFLYEEAIDESKTLVFEGRGNLYGWLMENNGAADVFVSFFDAADPGDVTLGVTDPKCTVKVEPNSSFGRDAGPMPYLFFGLGCVVAVVSTRNGAAAPDAPGTGHFWFNNVQG